MRYLFLLCLLWVALPTFAQDPVPKELELTLTLEAERRIGVLTIKNVTEKPVTLLDAFNRATGMTKDFPMGTSIRFQDAKWRMAYLISSNLYDHGPVFTSDSKTGQITARPPQKDVVLEPGKSLMRRFLIQPLLFYGSAQHLDSKQDPYKTRLPIYTYQLRLLVYVAEGERYRTQSFDSAWFSPPAPSAEDLSSDSLISSGASGGR